MKNIPILPLDFRAWHKKRRKMYDVLHLHIESETWATCKGFDIVAQKDIHIDVQPKDCVILQFTGVYDRNEKKIFNGDIVKVGSKIMKVVYNNGGFYTPHNNSKYRLGGWNKNSLQWLGNIYENKELLEEESVFETASPTDQDEHITGCVIYDF